MAVIAFVAVIIGLSFLIIVHELGHFLAAKFFKLRVDEFGLGYPPRMWGKKWGETIISFNWIPFGGFVRIFGEGPKSLINADNGADLRERAFYAQKIWKRAVIIASGVLMNFIAGWILLSFVFMAGIPSSLLITDIKEGSIAETAGITRGDQILGFKKAAELTNFLENNGGKEISLRLKRDGEEFPLVVTPRTEVPEGEGNLGVFLTETGLERKGILASFGSGMKESFTMLKLIFLGFIDLIIGVFTDISVLEQFVGPVGIVSVAVETTKLGIIYFFQLLSFISLNLVVLNLLPIPALDGFKLIFLLAEKMKGSPINPKLEMAAGALGFVFIMALLLAVTVKDVLMLF